MKKRLLVTGGAGFIGSAFVRMALHPALGVEKLINLDLLTYAANLNNLKSVEKDPRYLFVRGDILNGALVEELCRTHAIDAIVHFAAESHVDRSIASPRPFYRTNVEGTISLLEVIRRFPHIHFHHVSTDEVYGSIETGEFTENSPYQPNSPYAASKAASDHFVRAYHRTYGLLTTLSHCGNNFGPCQHLEKLIPRMIHNCLNGERLPIYGTGRHVRDWIFVDDHVEALWNILQNGKSGESYNVTAGFEMNNLDLVHLLIERIAKMHKKETKHYQSLIEFVADRPGHDFRYALSAHKLTHALGWKPRYPFPESLDRTIAWYSKSLA